MKYKYGDFSDMQIADLKRVIRKKIFFLLLCADKSCSDVYCKIDVPTAIENLLTEMDGLNELLLYPTELIKAMSLLTSAKNEYLKETFSFREYRKLILSAGAEIQKIREV